MANCIECGKKLTFINRGADGFCLDCQFSNEQREKERRKPTQKEASANQIEAASKIILTTETAHDLPIAQRLGIVTTEYVLGMHLFRDVASSFRDVFGGRSATMQKGLREAREAALTELRLEALALGADAVVGVDLDYSEISGGGKSMLFLVASGTAVSLRKDTETAV